MERSRIIAVQEYGGYHCTGSDDAEKLFHEIARALEAGQSAILEFGEVETLASSFLDVAVGRLYEVFEEACVDNGLRWTGVDNTSDRLITSAIKDAKAHAREALGGRRHS
jgi:hypothetical protein